MNKCKFYDNRTHEWEYSELLRKSQENKKYPPQTHIMNIPNFNKQPNFKQQFQNNNEHFSNFHNNNRNQNP